MAGVTDSEGTSLAYPVLIGLRGHLLLRFLQVVFGRDWTQGLPTDVLKYRVPALILCT